MVGFQDAFEDASVRTWDFPRSAAGVRVLVEYAVAGGLTAEVALAGSGLTPVDLAGGGEEVTAAQELRVVRNLRAGLGEVGAEVGRGYRAETFGILGYALLASPTLLDAMNVALRFLDLSNTFAIPRVEVTGDRVRISVSGADLPADVRRFLVERDAAAIRAVLDELVPGDPVTAVDRPGETVVVSLPIRALERPLARSDPGSLALSVALCRDVVDRRRRRSGTAGHTRVLITQRLASGAPMPDVAAALGLSERTLRRRLAGDGTTYQRLLDEVRQSLAEELLATGRLSVGEVAVRLGYAEASSFILAHRRWTGRTPGTGA